MHNLSDLIDSDCVFAGVHVATRKALFQFLGTQAEQQLGISARLVTDALGDREKLGSTGFGGGFAMPHARLPGIGRVHGLFVQLASPVDYGAVDDLGVDLVFALFSPEQAGARHLKALALVSRTFRDRSVREQLRGAQSRDAMLALMNAIDARDAA
jgi:PTS system nitrogen regulatory IIA component